MLLGAIADDLTGATDLALALAREGMRTVQLVGAPKGPIDKLDADAVIISLKSRTIPAAAAVSQSLASARALLAGGARQIFFKYCSTFDSTDAGNIGPVTEALLVLLGERLTIACPAFPANGRSVYKGHLFVEDTLLSDSPMKDHPLTPMRDPNLVRVLGRQTRLPVGLVEHKTVAVGPRAIEKALGDTVGILIVDALTEGDLRAIGAAAKSLRLVTGGSGLAIGLPANFRAEGLLPAEPSSRDFKAPVGRGVILAGSCSAATRRQIEAAKTAGLRALRLDPREIAAGRLSSDDVVGFVQKGAGTSLIYSSAEPSEVATIQQQLGREAAGGMIEGFLGEIACRLAAQDFRRFVVAGGETSGAVVEALGIDAMQIGVEIDPGVPWMSARGDAGELALALKSGNFGADDFFLRAMSMIQ